MDALKSFFQERRLYPMLVERNSIGKEMSGMEFNKAWASFDALPEESKDVLMSPEMSQKIESLQKERGLSDDHIEIVSAIIREYFVFKKDALWLENALMAKLDRKDVASVKEYIQKNILTIKPVPKAPEEDEGISIVQTVSLPLLDAMAKYQRLSEQSITEDRITVKGESQPVRGSLRNWVRHYRDALGIRKHSAMERGQFLFQGENTKRLGAADREKLSLLFRSLDENVPVSIDVERQEVIFPAFEEKATPSPVSGVSEQQKESTAPSLGTSFRPLEKFPVQTAPIHKALEWDRKAPPQNSLQPDLQGGTAVSSVETPSLELTKKPGLSVGISAPAYDFGALQKMSPSEPSSEPRVASPAMPPLPKSPVESPPFASGGKMSFSSSHILPSEKQSLKEKGDSGMLKPETSARDLAPKTLEAVGIIRPRGEGFGFRPLPSGSRSSDDKNSFDAPRVVNFGGGK